MNNSIQKYIDHNLINEYADKNFINGFSLDVSELSQHEQLNFLDFLFAHDEAIKEDVLNRMQELIDRRLEHAELEAGYEAGLKPIVDQNNGELIWINRGAA